MEYEGQTEQACSVYAIGEISLGGEVASVLAQLQPPWTWLGQFSQVLALACLSGEWFANCIQGFMDLCFRGGETAKIVSEFLHPFAGSGEDTFYRASHT